MINIDGVEFSVDFLNDTVIELEAPAGDGSRAVFVKHANFTSNTVVMPYQRMYTNTNNKNTTTNNKNKYKDKQNKTSPVKNNKKTEQTKTPPKKITDFFK